MNIKEFLTLSLILTLAGCRGPLPCPDCEADDEEDPVPDLPCGGADLQTDALNCGSCGNECPIGHAGTEYAVGQCKDGQCGGLNWYEQVYSDPDDLPQISCAEACASDSATCVEQGCSGKTGYICAYFFGEGCLFTDPFAAITDWTGACADDVPWPDFDPPDDGVRPALGCCCEWSP